MSYYVKRINHSSNWSLWETYFENKVRKQRRVPDIALHGLGVNRDSQIEEARARVSQLNKEKSEEKRSLVRSARQVESVERVKSLFVPGALAEAFEQYLNDNFVTHNTSDTKLLSHWSRVQKLVRDLKLLPPQFFANKPRIVTYLIKANYSFDYSKKLIRILNLWGDFVSERNGQFYRPIPKLMQLDVQRLTDSYTRSERHIGESKPLTPQLLAKFQANLKETQWKWLHVALYFGLRPSEIDRRNSKNFKFKVEYNKSIKKHVVKFYQPKLVSLPEERRWKSIPVILPEQELALEYLKEELKAPLPRTLQAYADGLHLTKYCGRKGFVDLMLSHGQIFENISAWMGHTSVDRTWRSYRNKDRVSFTPTG